MVDNALLSNELKLERFRLAFIKSHCENDAEKKKRGIYNRGTIKKCCGSLSFEIQAVSRPISVRRQIIFVGIIWIVLFDESCFKGDYVRLRSTNY